MRKKMTPAQLEAKRERGRKWSKANPERKKAHYASKKIFYQRYERDRQYKKMYGISIEIYEDMLASQGGGCKMCRATRGGPKRATFSVDHCHATGRVRGLLCTRCNVAVGFYEKNHALVEKYLADIVY